MACVWQMQSTSLTHQQEGAKVVMANTDCCDQVGFLPLVAMFTSSTTHQCPTARESNHSFTSLTQEHFPLATAMFRDTQPRSSYALTKATCCTHSHADGFKPVDSQLEKLKWLTALILLTQQKHPLLTQEVNVGCATSL